MNESAMRRRLVLRFITGTDEFGKDLIKNTTINNVRTDSETEQLESFANFYGAMSGHIHLESIVVNEHLLARPE